MARRSGGVFRARDAAEADVHSRDLYALRDEGILIELSRGVFRFADAEMISDLDLVAVSKRSPRGTICLNSALSFWDLTDEVPAEVHLAALRGSRPPSIECPPVRVHVFAASTLRLGVRAGPSRIWGGDLHLLPGTERSRCHASERPGVGADVAYEALTRYLKHPGFFRRSAATRPETQSRRTHV